MQNLCGSCLPAKQRDSDSSIERTSLASKRTSYVSGPKIIIIGAGAAGLACAMKLMEYGITDITILEGERRAGGRIYTLPFADGVADLGAQWVHGEQNNVVFDMVKHLGVLDSSGDVYVTFECIRSNGEVVPEEIVLTLKELLADLFINKRQEMTEYDGSFGEFLKEAFFEELKLPKYDDIDKDVIEEFFENFKKMESSESAVGLDQVSARGFLEYWDCDGDYMLNWKDRGFQEFLRVLTNAKRNEHFVGELQSKLKLNKTVTLIEWDRDNGMVRVVCDNMSEPMEADNVVITVSLGVLKKFGSTLFKPALPAQKVTAIEGLGFGDVLKIFIEFPFRFWPPKWTGFTTLWRKEDIEELIETKRAWIQEIYGFYMVNYQPRVLVAWAVGPAVVEIEHLTSQELQLHMMYILTRFLTTWSIPEPVSILSTKWSSNDHFCGAYSFRTIQTEVAATSANALAQPLNTILTVPLENISTEDNAHENENGSEKSRLTIKPTVLFAGEATSTHYFSTVHGAVESGWREAKRLAGYYQFEV